MGLAASDASTDHGWTPFHAHDHAITECFPFLDAAARKLSICHLANCQHAIRDPNAPNLERLGMKLLDRIGEQLALQA
jgi:hypothetical protein